MTIITSPVTQNLVLPKSGLVWALVICKLIRARVLINTHPDQFFTGGGTV